LATKKVNKNYQKGAQFERDMLIHLRGDPKKNTTGWMHQTMVSMFDGIIVPDIVLSSLKIFACRTPGSK